MDNSEIIIPDESNLAHISEEFAQDKIKFEYIINNYVDRLKFYNAKSREYTSNKKDEKLDSYDRRLLIGGLSYRHNRLVEKVAKLRTAIIEAEKCFALDNISQD